MCAPIAIGIATAVVGAVGSIAQYQQQQSQVAAANDAAWQQTVLQNRQINSAANQNLQQSIFNMQMQNRQVKYQNQLTTQQTILQMDQVVRSNLSAHREWQQAMLQNTYANRQQKLDYQGRLNQSLLSQNAASLQQGMNQRALNADLEASQIRLQDARAQAAFESERLMASNLQAQGTVLARGSSGQSIGLAVQSVNAAYGRDMNMVGTNYANSVEDFYSDSYKAYLAQIQRDAEAISRIIPEPAEPIGLPKPPKPIYAPLPDRPVLAPFMTNPGPYQPAIFAPAPTQQPGPSGIGLVAGIGSSIVGGVQAGYQANSYINPAPSSGR
jgi:hypothetical protein